jgi:hypothetical protein
MNGLERNNKSEIYYWIGSAAAEELLVAVDKVSQEDTMGFPPASPHLLLIKSISNEKW